VNRTRRKTPVLALPVCNHDEGRTTAHSAPNAERHGALAELANAACRNDAGASRGGKAAAPVPNTFRPGYAPRAENAGQEWLGGMPLLAPEVAVGRGRGER
jgi:hypothetical protein